MNNFFQDLIISYLLKRKAPKRITYSSDRETRVFGFWIYLGERGDKFIIQNRIARLKYKCIKVDAPADEAGENYTKYITIENGYSFSDEVFVNLYHNGLQITDLSPLKAYLYGVTKFYFLIGWYENYRYRKSIERNEKAYSLYRDRLSLLELIMDVRNKQHEESGLFPEKISHETLLKTIAKASVVSSQGYYTYVEPVLKGLAEDKVISISGDNEIEILPKAWNIVSDYYVDERRHEDNQMSLRWQRYLTALLAIVSFGNIFKDEIRIFFGL